MEGYHRYEHEFVDEAALSQDSFISDREGFRARGGFAVLNQEERTEVAIKRLDRLKQLECSICQEQMRWIPGSN